MFESIHDDYYILTVYDSEDDIFQSGQIAGSLGYLAGTYGKFEGNHNIFLVVVSGSAIFA